MNIQNISFSTESILVVPRILFEGWGREGFQTLLGSNEEINALAKTIVKACKNWNFDGAVLEIWSQIAKRVENDMLLLLVEIIGKLN